MKKTISMFLALIMVISVSTTSVFATTIENQIEQVQSELQTLQAEIEKIRSEYKIVWVGGSILQHGSPFIIKNDDPTLLIGTVYNTSLLYWIDDIDVEKNYGNYIDSYSGYMCYLGEETLYNHNGTTPMIVNHMGPVPDSYTQVLNKINTKSDELIALIEKSGDFGSANAGDANRINGFSAEYHSNGSVSEEGMYVDGVKQGWFACYMQLPHDMLEPTYYVNGESVWSNIDSARSLFNTEDAETNTIFMQLGNPFFFAYGNWQYHEYQNLNATPVAIEGRSLIPIRSFIEAVGGTAEWDGTNNQVIVQLNPNNKVIFTVGSNIAIVNGVSKTMDIKAQIINGKTMIPLRFACESVGITDITYDAPTQSIVIKYPQTEVWNNGLLNNPDAAG